MSTLKRVSKDHTEEAFVMQFNKWRNTVTISPMKNHYLEFEFWFSEMVRCILVPWTDDSVEMLHVSRADVRALCAHAVVKCWCWLSYCSVGGVTRKVIKWTIKSLLLWSLSPSGVNTGHKAKVHMLSYTGIINAWMGGALLCSPYREVPKGWISTWVAGPSRMQ